MLNKISSLSKYIEEIIKLKSDHMIIIVSKDNIGIKLDDRHADLLLNLGIKTDLSYRRGLNGRSYCGYIAVFDGGLNKAEIFEAAFKEARYKDEKYNIQSTVYMDGTCKSAYLFINNEKFNYLTNKRGLNFVIINKNNRVIDSACFDTSLPNYPCSRIDCDKERGEFFELHKKYENFLKNYIPKKLSELRLFKPNYPFGEAALISGVSSEKFINFVKSENLFLAHIPGNKGLIISHIPSDYDKNENFYTFSGTAFVKVEEETKFIVGMDDIKENNITITQLHEATGEFELIYYSNNTNTIGITTDFFGIGKWFYYKNNNVFIAATSYHFILLLLEAAGEKLSLNHKSACALFGGYNYMTSHLFSKNMPINNVKLLYAYEKIVLRENNIIVTKTNLFEPEVNRDDFNKTRYEKLLFKAKDELIENCRAIFCHSQFDKISVDLTDGLDTRQILAAVTNLPASLNEKVRINTANPLAHGNSISDDYKTACAISSAFGYEWKNLKTEKIAIDLSSGYKQNLLSAHLNCCFTDTDIPKNFEVRFPKTIRLSGGNGEVSTGMLYEWYYNFGKNSIVNLTNQIFFINNEHKESAQALCELLNNEIGSYPGILLWQLNLFYLNFRNRFHFCNKYNTTSPLCCFPINIKFGWLLKKEYFKKNFDFKPQFDLIKLLNPLIANFPYISKKQQDRYSISCAHHYNNDKPKIKIVPDYDDSLFATQKNIETLLPNSQLFNEKMKSQKHMFDGLVNDYFSEDAYLSALKTVILNIPEIGDEGLELFKFAFDNTRPDVNSYDNSIAVRRNKLLGLYYQIELINTSNTTN